MATLTSMLATLLLIFFTYVESAPSTVVMPVKRDASGTGFTLELKHGSNLKAQQLNLDMEQDVNSVHCVSSNTFKPASCQDQLCKSYEHSACANNTCTVPASSTATLNLGSDPATVVGDDGKTVTATVASACSTPERSVPRGTSGVAGLSFSVLGMPRQISSALNIKPQLTLRLPSGRATGAAFVGAGPTVQRDMQTFLVKNPKHSDKFYVQLKGIQVGGASVALDANMLEVDSNGNGGTKLSTTVQYTQLALELYKPLVDSFVKMAAMKKMKRVESVSPFSACFDGRTVMSLGRVPQIDKVFPGNGHDVAWSVHGANSMVQAKKGVLCLAFVDAGANPMTSFVIGNYQMQDTLVVLDLSNSLLEIESSNVSCSNVGL